jgi:hypothetical protein
VKTCCARAAGTLFQPHAAPAAAARAAARRRVRVRVPTCARASQLLRTGT